ncbi:hypothetical protein BS47DRAFT_1370101 [Hydnum rufescens UP504]|uniref:Uncharacterized protein n=1 Tax=Hydnum rufescens UP504 TaxID=1448309 RepID=A0A9P6AAT4_9AGAM|nr:hypothetical protein BS47DRAFT_1370101 [Hydnum rufescens UP504]
MDLPNTPNMDLPNTPNMDLPNTRYGSANNPIPDIIYIWFHIWSYSQGCGAVPWVKLNLYMLTEVRGHHDQANRHSAWFCYIRLWVLMIYAGHQSLHSNPVGWISIRDSAGDVDESWDPKGSTFVGHYAWLGVVEGPIDESGHVGVLCLCSFDVPTFFGDKFKIRSTSLWSRPTQGVGCTMSSPCSLHEQQLCGEYSFLSIIRKPVFVVGSLTCADIAVDLGFCVLSLHLLVVGEIGSRRSRSGNGGVRATLR